MLHRRSVVLMLALCLTTAVAHADVMSSVGINFRGPDFVSGMAPGVTAGAVVSHANWNSTRSNNTDGVSSGTTADIGQPGITGIIVDSTGVDSGLTIAWDFNGTFQNFGGTATGDQRLMNGYVDEQVRLEPDFMTEQPGTVTISNIPVGYIYDVYAYFGASSNDRPGSIGINGSTLYGFDTFSAGKVFPTDYLAATTTLASLPPFNPAVDPDYAPANYAVWSDLTGSSFTLEVTKVVPGGNGNVGLHGLQIVVREPEVVPEPTSIAIWGIGLIGMAGFVYRRRKRFA